MSEGINRVILLGNLGQDPELRNTQNSAVLNMRLCTNEVYWVDGERRERTEWHTVVVWGKRATGLASFLQKGATLMVEGRLQTRSWEDQQGNKRYATEVVADRVITLGGAGGERRRIEREPEQPDPTDDIPF